MCLRKIKTFMHRFEKIYHKLFSLTIDITTCNSNCLIDADAYTFA